MLKTLSQLARAAGRSRLKRPPVEFEHRANNNNILLDRFRCVSVCTNIVAGLHTSTDLPKPNIFSLDGIGRNFGCRDRNIDCIAVFFLL